MWTHVLGELGLAGFPWSWKAIGVPFLHDRLSFLTPTQSRAITEPNLAGWLLRDRFIMSALTPITSPWPLASIRKVKYAKLTYCDLKDDSIAKLLESNDLATRSFWKQKLLREISASYLYLYCFRFILQIAVDRLRNVNDRHARRAKENTCTNIRYNHLRRV